MEHKELQEYLKKEYGGYAIFEPEHYDEGIIGITEDGRVIYSYALLAETLMLHDEMTYEDAIEWLDYNTVRSIPYMGEYQPVMMYEYPEIDDEFLLGVDDYGAPIYAFDNIPENPKEHAFKLLLDFYDWDDENPVPEPIILYPLPKKND